jgi:hypothetical protein
VTVSYTDAAASLQASCEASELSSLFIFFTGKVFFWSYGGFHDENIEASIRLRFGADLHWMHGTDNQELDFRCAE